METAQRRKSSIPDEIIFEIFSWLPVKILMRFKCVSKFCNSLISDSYFREIHQSHSVHRRHDKITKFLVFSEGDQENLYTKELEQTTKTSRFRVEKLDSGSSTKSTYAKGLLCLWDPDNLIDYQPAIILNPSTRETRFLPYLSSAVDQETLVNHDHHYRCYCSLGFDSYKRRHKILMTLVYDDGENKSTRHWIFTLGDESWREIKSNIPYVKPVFLGGGVHIDGIIYFFSSYHNSTSEEICIVAFDVRTEKFRIISSLWYDHVHWIDCFMHYHLVEHEGKIAAVDSSSAHVWILQSRPDKTEIWLQKKLVLEKERFRINGENIVLGGMFNPNLILLCDLKKRWWRTIDKILVHDREKDNIIGIYSCDEDSLYSL